MSGPLANMPADRIVVSGAFTAGGAHCETTALNVLLRHAGLELSEPMLFGLGSGLSFIYWDSKRQELPFLGGRVKPFELTQNLSERLKLTLRVQETSSPRIAWDQVSDLISEGIPVGLQLDSHELDYFSSRIHFAGHIVALYGYDDQNAYLVDTAQQGGAVTTSLESLARARAARGPMSARHRSFSITASQSPSASNPAPLDPAPLDPASAIIPAILLCAEKFLNPPMKNVGHQGIRTAAKRMQNWFERIENPEQGLALRACLRWF